MYIVNEMILPQGERRFYLGGVVDDLFLSTPQWEYLPEKNFSGTLVRFDYIVD